MAHGAILDDRGRAVETITATEAKNAFGRLLDTALARGVVAITKRDRVRAIVLSFEAYDALVNNSPGVSKSLDAELDALAGAMQTPRARRAVDRLFAASSVHLGRAAVATAAPARRPVKVTRKRA